MTDESKDINAVTKALDMVVLIPSLHPDHLLTEYIDDLVAKGFGRILLVDDGSGPEYAQLFQDLTTRPGCEVIGYPVNGGKGHALKHGMRHIQAQYPDAPGVVTADSDGQHTAEDLMKVAQALIQRPDALIIGSRDFKADNVPGKSRAGNRLTSVFFALLYGKWLPDTQTGLRGFSKELIPFMLSVEGDRFEYEMNMLIQASGHHIPFEIVGIRTIYIEENRRTHFRPFKDSARIYAQLFKNFFKYASASGLSTALDLLLFTLLDKWLLPQMGLDAAQTLVWDIAWQVFLATAIARACSAVFNYKANKSFVFQVSRCKGSFGRYLLLAVIVMSLSAALVSTLHGWLGFDKTLLKVFVDTILFFVNYRLQRAWVFADRRQERNEA